MSEIPETIFDQIAKLLPPDLREHFFRRIAHLRDLSPNDDMLLIAEAMGFLALLIRETPPLITAERQALENLHRYIVQSNTQLEDHLVDLPAEIQAGIDADAIAAKIAESIRQSFIQNQLASVAQELHLHVGTITEATRQLAAMAAGLDDSHSGIVARSSRQLPSCLPTSATPQPIFEQSAKTSPAKSATPLPSCALLPSLSDFSSAGSFIHEATLNKERKCTMFKLKPAPSTTINAPNPRASSLEALDKTATILYSVSEAAAKLCVAPKWLYERTRKNAVPCRRLGKYIRFSDADLAAIVANAFVPVANGSISGTCGNVHADDRNKNRQGANDAPSAC